MRRRFISYQGLQELFDYNYYLTIEALEDGLTVVFNKEIEYGIDGVGWKKLRGGLKSPSINKGHTISFRAKLTPTILNGIGTFTISNACNLIGNIMSLLFYNDAASATSLIGFDYAFCRLFSNCTTIKSVSSNFTPAATLTNSCYYSMFQGCTSLVNAPELPATTLADSCYSYMFTGCTSLTTAPELPATTLADSCYYSMFYGCSSLTTAPVLPATTLADDCYQQMFYGCTSLTTAPELPATTLVHRCYEYMFYGCKKLNYIKMLATDVSAYDCLHWWVNDVASMGTFIKHKDAVLPTGASGIPEGWTVVNDGEESGWG